MLTVYGMSDSGNCYKVKLALEQLALPYRWVEITPSKGETRSAEFLAMNPNGKVPTLGLEDGGWLAERLGRARVLQWMFFEQYSHEPYIAVARSIVRGTPPGSPRRAELPRLQERGNAALAVMQRHLQVEPWFAAGRYSIADIALFAYTHSAGEGGFDLARTPAVKAWLERVRAQPRFVPMQ